MTVAATLVSTGVLEFVATVGGALLVWSRFLDWASHRYVLGFLAVTYVLWAAALWRNLIVNWRLLEATGTSTNVCAKAAYEIVRLRSRSRRAMKVGSMGGYIFTEVAKEVPYYAGAFATALVSDSVDSSDALIFLPRWHDHRRSALRVRHRPSRRDVSRPARAAHVWCPGPNDSRGRCGALSSASRRPSGAPERNSPPSIGRSASASPAPSA